MYIIIIFDDVGLLLLRLFVCVRVELCVIEYIEHAMGNTTVKYYDTG